MLFRETVILHQLTTCSNAGATTRKLTARLTDLLRLAWRKVCPWDPGDFPEIDAFYARPKRPPTARRHNFGRRNACDDVSETAGDSFATEKKSVSLTLSVTGTSASVK